VLVCGVYLLSRYPAQYRVRILSVLLLAAALSIFNNAGKHLLLQISPRLPAVLFIRWGTICVIFSSWLYLILIFLEKRGYWKVPRFTPWAVYAIPPLAALLTFAFFRQSPLAGIEIVQRLLYVAAGVIVLLTVGVLLKAYRSTKDPILKAQLKWILWGHTLGMSPYIVLYSLPKGLLGTPFIHYSWSLTSFPIIVFAYMFAFYRYRLMDVDRVIHGSFVYGITAAFLVALYLLFLSVIYQRFALQAGFESWLQADLLLLLGAALVFNPLKNLIQKGIDRTLFPERLGISSLFLEESNKLARAADLREIAEYLLGSLPMRVGIEKAAWALRPPFGGPWETKENPNEWILQSEGAKELLDRLAAEPGASCRFLFSTQEDPLLPSPYLEWTVKGATTAFPLKSADDLWGFYIIGSKRNNRLLTQEEIHVFENLCAQAAHMIGNARLMEGLQKTNRSLADLSNRLIQAEKMADLGEGAATLAHELKTPLGILRGSAEVLRKAKDPAEKEKVLTFILEEVDRLTKTVDDFLRFARMSPPSKTETDLNNLVQSAAYLWESKRKNEAPIDIQFHLDPGFGKVLLDPRQAYQVLLNVFTNAEEAMPEGGRLSISTLADPNRGGAVIAIGDSGKGIPPENLPRVFDRFFTTKETGLGLGLAIVKKIMEAHGGEVAVESTPGHGTRVAISFPVIPDKLIQS
jgi:signal transduction histidine kinase